MRRSRARALAPLLLLAAACSDDPAADPAPTTTTTTSASAGTPATTSGETAGGPATSTSTTVAPGARGYGCAPVIAADPALADGPSERTVGELLASIPDLARFRAALDAAGVDLTGPGPRTVLAPIDPAFDALPTGTAGLLAEDPSGAGAAIVALHVVDGDVPIEALVAAGTTAVGDGVVGAADDGTVTLVDAGGGPATVICAGLAAADGQLIVLDRVLLPAPIDTNALGGSRLFTVDLASGAAGAGMGFGGEVGVLGLAARADGDLVALTDAGRLLTVAADDPAHPRADVAVTGTEGSTLLALDTAPDGADLAVTDAGTLVRIDPVTGTATAIGHVELDDIGVGLDVSATGRMRLVVATGHHVVAPIDGDASVEPDPAPAPTFVDGDPHAGSPARVVAIASSGDTLYAVEAVAGVLATMDAQGGLSTVGPLGITLTEGASFDIAADGTAYLAVPG